MTSDLLSPQGRYSMIPRRVRAALDAHVHDRRPSGGFVTALLENNLSLAFMQADDYSRAAMLEIVLYLWDELPADSWGSAEHVRRWIGQERAPSARSPDLGSA
jgi:hypothetical protein